ncbi:MAG: hypothetical protein CMH55_09505 [Myxococcales bacterium]|nr:hypothetical protein [Myxococcales bacterium]
MKIRVIAGFVFLFVVLSQTACAPECENHGQCPLGSLCSSGQCVGEDRPCAMHQDCRDGEACRGGVCVADDIQCTTHTECPHQRVCRSNICQVPAVGDPCASHPDCGVSLYCRVASGQCAALEAGRCWSDDSCAAGVRCENIDPVSGLGDCGEGDDCGGQRCGGETPHCAGDRCVECLTPQHCSGSEDCEDGVCRDEESGCETDRDCPEARPRCDGQSGQCYECFLDGDCEAGETCRNNLCEPPAGQCGGVECPPARPICVADRCEECEVNAHCGEGEVCDQLRCVDGGGPGELAYGETCAERAACRSEFCGFVGDPPQRYCTQACGASLDCPMASTCITLAHHGVTYCVPGDRVHARFDRPQNSACQTFADCRSGVCANTPNGPFCQQDCTNDSHCRGEEACMGTLLDEQQQLAVRVCGGLAGTVPNGSACDPNGTNNCRAGLCDNTTNRCQPMCCKSSDCEPGLRCNPTRVVGNQIWGLCGSADIQLGPAGVGNACGGDSDCRSGWCLAGVCSDLCCTDSDCGRGRCRPYNLGTEEEPALVNACQ